MINWFKKVFSTDKIKTNELGLPRVDNIVPMPEVKPPKPEKDISEPVFAIAECMKKYPSRFKIKSFTGRCRLEHSWSDDWIVTDTKTKEKFYILEHFGLSHKNHLVGYFRTIYIKNGVFTQDEIEYLRYLR